MIELKVLLISILMVAGREYGRHAFGDVAEHDYELLVLLAVVCNEVVGKVAIDQQAVNLALLGDSAQQLIETSISGGLEV